MRLTRLTCAALLLPAAACAGGAPEETAPAPPPGLTSDAALEARGAALFQQNCVLCHGERGDGKGVRHTFLEPGPPPDYASASFRQRATPTHVFFTIRHGRPNTSMPAWHSFTDDEVWALTAHVLNLSRSR